MRFGRGDKQPCLRVIDCVVKDYLSKYVCMSKYYDLYVDKIVLCILLFNRNCTSCKTDYAV